MKSNNVHWERLGNLVEPHKHRCGDNNAIVSGVDINKQFISTRANLEGVDVSSYYSVPPKHFACNLMHIGRDIRIPIAYNNTENTYVVTSAYYIFRVKESRKKDILEEYLYMFFNSREKDRLTWFYTDGSVRGNLPEQRFLDIQVPLFDTIEEQQTIVDAWKCLRNIKEQNEALAAPLMQLCQSYIQECKHRYESKELRTYIDEINVRNDKEIFGENELRGVTSNGVFDDSRASTDGLSFKNYKVVNYSQFAYNPSRINLGSIAINQDITCIISPMYVVFEVIKTDELLPEYLALWTRRKEFQRSTLFFASGSVRDTFGFENMKNTTVPLPPIDVQRAIVSLYQSALEYKKIAAEADAQSRSICSALMQHAINS